MISNLFFSFLVILPSSLLHLLFLSPFTFSYSKKFSHFIENSSFWLWFSGAIFDRHSFYRPYVAHLVWNLSIELWHNYFSLFSLLCQPLLDKTTFRTFNCPYNTPRTYLRPCYFLPIFFPCIAKDILHIDLLLSPSHTRVVVTCIIFF